MRDLLRRGVRRRAYFVTDDPAVTATALLSLGIDVSRWYAAGGWSPDQVADHYAELALRMVGASGSSPG